MNKEGKTHIICPVHFWSRKKCLGDVVEERDVEQEGSIYIRGTLAEHE
jgi:hypothetical protein